MKRTLFALSLSAAVLGGQAQAAQSTRWSFTPSETFDALCLAGVMADDPFYVPYYQKQHDELGTRLTAAARAAFKAITTRSKADGDIASA